MKKLILFTLTTLLLLNCSNGANEPCKDENCLTDKQLNFFKMHLEDDTLTKKVLFEMSSMDLSSKDITSLDTGIFNNLINLTSVDLTGNPICSVDKGDVGLADTVTLNLTPIDARCITNEQLDFFSGHIMSITTKKELYEAPTLNLSSKDITSLPNGIFNNLNSLTNLSLYNNQLTNIPTEIGKLTNITDLNLSFNKLTSIPTEIGNLTSLTTLSLSENDLTSIPAGIFTKLTNLTELYVNNNQIASIPAGIGNLTSLTTLWLYSNQLASIPTEIGNLTNLTTLLLYSNNLTSIPAGIFTKLTNLTALWLKLGSSDTNTFNCNSTNYSTWGLTDPTTTIDNFICI